MKQTPHFTRKFFNQLIAALTAVALLLASCAPAPKVPTGAPAAAENKPVEVKLALLTIVDALPFFVATKQGYFTANNVDVTFIPAASAAERDQLMTAGQADGMINDLISTVLYNKQNVQIQIVRFSRVATKEAPMYRILAASKSGIKNPKELAGVPIGISQGTVIDYVTARLLQKEGLTPDQIKTEAVPKMPDRLALLGSGQLKAATLPEPFSTIAQETSGAVLVVDDSKYPEYGNSVISFRKSFIDQNPEAVKGFLTAVEKAVADINKDPNAWRSLLGENKLVPANVQATYPVPPFPPASVPTEAQWKDVIDWMKSRSLVDKDLPYAESITPQYLPK